jgi:diamine N-acetyltransferase
MSTVGHQPEVQIAPFDLTDVNELACLALQTHADTYGHQVPAGDLNEIANSQGWVLQLERAAQIDSILAAKLGGRIVGYAQFGAGGDQERQLWPRSRELRKLYVASELQGQGIGRQLMDRVLASPVLASAPQVYLWVWGRNTRAVKFYEGYEFNAVGARHYALDGQPYHDSIMVRTQVVTR